MEETSRPNMYLHGENPQLLRGQLLHLLRQNLRFFQDGKLRVGSTKSTRKKPADPDEEAPGKRQRAAVNPQRRSPQSSAQIRREARRCVAGPLRHDGRAVRTNTGSEGGADNGSKEQTKQLFFTTLQSRRLVTVLACDSVRTPPRRGAPHFLEILENRKTDPCGKTGGFLRWSCSGSPIGRTLQVWQSVCV